MASRNPSVRAFMAALPPDYARDKWSVVAHPEVTYVLLKDPVFMHPAGLFRDLMPDKLLGMPFAETVAGKEPGEWRLYHDGTLKARGYVYDTD
jgi:hypothetical protein